MSIPCPKCGTSTITLETRTQPKGVRRRRQCRGCKGRFSTLEVIVSEHDYTGAVLAEGYGL